jgi:predicted nucleic acid-binding protein
LKELVLDASATLSLILPDEHAGGVDDILNEMERGTVRLCLPHLWLYEVGNALVAARRRERLMAEEADLFLGIIEEWPIRYYAMQALQLRNCQRLANEQALSFYDASYLELALRLEIPLVSLDQKLSGAYERLSSLADGMGPD